MTPEIRTEIKTTARRLARRVNPPLNDLKASVKGLLNVLDDQERSVWLAWHIQGDQDRESLIGIFSSQDKARDALKKALQDWYGKKITFEWSGTLLLPKKEDAAYHGYVALQTMNRMV